MGNISVTVIDLKKDGTRSYTPPSPIVMTIGIGESYDLLAAGTGSSLYNAEVDTVYTLVEAPATVAALIDASKTVTIQNTPNDGFGLDVSIQDQTTPTIIADFTSTPVASTTLSGATAIDDTTISVTSATNFVVGQHLTITNPSQIRYYFAHITAIVSTTITVDAPLDFAFNSGSAVVVSSDQLAVDGSSTTQIFSIRGGAEGAGAVPVEFDCTRIIIMCVCATAVDLTKFGDLTALTNGLVMRRTDGEYHNIFNVHDNGDIANVMLNWQSFVATKPNEGIDGFVASLTFSGQHEMGVTLRIGPNEDLEFLIQDNLSGLTSLKIIAEGSIVLQPA